MPILVDGRDVAPDSPEWRHECEARAIAAQTHHIPNAMECPCLARC